MQVGMNRSLGFQGNYALKFKNPEDARAFKMGLNSVKTSSELDEKGYGRYETNTDFQNPTKVVVRTANPQYSLYDQAILNRGLYDLTNCGSLERQRLSVNFDNHAEEIYLKA